MKIVWTEQAFERLREISDYIAFDSPEVASKFIDTLIQRGESLSNFPKSGRVVPEIDAEDIREIIEGNYRLVYRLKKNAIEILTIFESRRELPVNEIAQGTGRSKKK